MMWRDNQERIPKDDAGRPRYRGWLSLMNDRAEVIGSIVWFYDSGPFYAAAVDPKEPDVMRRIGPLMTLDAAKASCCRGAGGEIPDLDKRAGYSRD